MILVEGQKPGLRSIAPTSRNEEDKPQRKSKRTRGNRREENTLSLSKEFLKRWDANRLLSTFPNGTRLIWNGAECRQENATSLTTRTRPNGNCIW